LDLRRIRWHGLGRERSKRDLLSRYRRELDTPERLAHARRREQLWHHVRRQCEVRIFSYRE
jgi:hypothetical protein